MIALYRGTSLISRAIKFLNWSEYSHAAWITPDGRCVEAWITNSWKLEGSVLESPRFDSIHTDGTVVDFYSVKGFTPEQELQVAGYMRKQLFLPYDFRGIFKFLTRGMSSNNSEWFCSELVFSALKAANVTLLNLPAWKVYPAMLSYSPLVEFSGTKICGDNSNE